MHMKTPKGSLYSRHEAYRLLADNNIKTTKLRVYIIFYKKNTANNNNNNNNNNTFVERYSVIASGVQIIADWSAPTYPKRPVWPEQRCVATNE